MSVHVERFVRVSVRDDQELVEALWAWSNAGDKPRALWHRAGQGTAVLTMDEREVGGVRDVLHELGRPVG